MLGDTNRQNWPIGSLAVCPFVGAQSLNFWNSIQKPAMMMERKQKPVFGCISLSQRDAFA